MAAFSPAASSTFAHRTEAGQRLARLLRAWRGAPGALVLALPRGGVPVAAEVARALGLPLDVLVVRKLGFPQQEEVAMGAIASGGVSLLLDDEIAAAGVPPAAVEAVARREEAELARREAAYRGGLPPLDLAGRTVIVVDDGLATGATLRAAVAAIRRRGAARIVAAVPVGDPATCAALEREADEVVCTIAPRQLIAVGAWYDDFPQLDDDEVRRLLAEAPRPVQQETLP
ncbi:phosphoribosyltransferase [Xylophilus sp.]|uniref:phosphoribosyltransferase n=1 Tax=Xylophilus sp. TaxID=2653893 RepID=UPI0013BBBDCF|nr:phosphoribosyltransferase family protein [Xylophilus sp.]KAF1050031.1 MAG: hypothetical protein GAK38_00055 [Xylophilus sp.]